MIAPEKPRVLIATCSLTGFGGTDLYVRDLALSLLRNGWLPVVYSTNHGRLTEELRRSTIPVVNRLDAIASRPHVIHGNHIVETLAALARFPNVPAIYVSHDALTWHSVPPSSPRIRVYVAVDRNCRDRMALEYGIPEESIRVFTNAVELSRFKQRPPLPPRPLRALVFSNQAAQNNWVAPIRAACARNGISLDVIGLSSGRYAEAPEEILPAYDVVFAKARCAIEALAVGNAVIVADHAGMASIVTSNNVAELQQLNFGARTLQRPITVETVLGELRRYDPADAAAVSERIRASADVDLLARQFIALYDEVREQPLAVSAEDDLRAAGESLERVLPVIYGGMARPDSIARRAVRLLANSRALAAPARLLYRLKRLAGV